MFIAKTLAYVRRADGTTVQLAEGDEVPADADSAQVERFVALGVIEQAAEPKPPRGGGRQPGPGDD